MGNIASRWAKTSSRCGDVVVRKSQKERERERERKRVKARDTERERGRQREIPGRRLRQIQTESTTGERG